jgi:amidase
MRFEEYRKHDAIALAGLVAKREVSAKEVLETAIARAEQVNPAINAIVHKQYEQARKAVAAGLPEGPLKGVPYLIKDLGFFETGEPATFGSSLFKNFVADHETAYVTRCKKAGLVFMGRSSSPEFGLNANTEPRLYGSCHNPWNAEYSPGGSSGGAAAAVSAGVLPVAHATDGGGSIRIPASQCGLFGLKPSRAGCLWRQTQAKDGVVYRPDTWSAAVCATRPSCSIALPDRSPATPMPRRCPSAPSSKPSPVRRASSGSL